MVATAQHPPHKKMFVLVYDANFNRDVVSRGTLSDKILEALAPFRARA
jgi:hypothetical protein